MPERNKKPNKPMSVYILTQTGAGFNDENRPSPKRLGWTV